MNWTDVLENPKALASLYSETHTLAISELVEIGLQRDGPTLTLRAELDRFPDRRPARWHADANRVQISLSLGIESIEIRGWSTTNRGRLSIAPAADGRFEFMFSSDVLRVHGTATFMRLQAISEYQDADALPPDESPSSGTPRPPALPAR